MEIFITHIDTACVLLEINGYRILTDPTLDNAGELYHHGFGAISRKRSTPALPPELLPPVDLVLLSHHQHKDNFDHRGEEFTRTVANVISTKSAARALPNVIGLASWEQHCLVTDKVPQLTITATPAQHHPWYIPEFISGEVTGFIIEFAGQQNGVIYISGDTVYFKGIAEVGRRYKVDIGILHAGAVKFQYLTGPGKYTMNGKELLQAVNVLQPNKIVPIHHEGWSHFTETTPQLQDTFNGAPDVNKRTIFLHSGVRTAL